MKKKKRRYVIVETDQAKALAFAAAMKKGDIRCRFKVGDQVQKAVSHDTGDTHVAGHKGEITGAMYAPNFVTPYPLDKEGYMIIWEGETEETLVVGSRITAISNN